MNDRTTRLKERSFTTEPAICTERAELLTAFYREINLSTVEAAGEL